MALTLSGTNGVVGAGFTLDASGASVTAGVGTFGSLNAPAAGLTGALPALNAASLTQIPAANIVGVCTSGLTKTGGFGGITMADSWRVSASFSPSSGNNTITANWERDDFRFEKIGDGLSQSSGIFTFPETGKYLFHWNHSAYDTDERRYVGVIVKLSVNNGSSYDTIAETYDSTHDPSSSSSFTAGAMTFMVDVTDASQFKFYWQTSISANVNFDANTNQQRTGFSVIRIGDT